MDQVISGLYAIPVVGLLFQLAAISSTCCR